MDASGAGPVSVEQQVADMVNAVRRGRRSAPARRRARPSVLN